MTTLDGSQCIALTDLGARDACVLGQIGRVLKDPASTTASAATADLFVPADQIDTTVTLSPSPAWTYAGTSTIVCNNANTNWLGVKCGQVGGTGAYRVTSVDLQSVGLRGFKPFSGTIPTMFAMLTALTYLNLANNKLSGTLPAFTTTAVDYIPVAFQSKSILAVPPSLTVFNVTGNRLGLTLTAGVKAAVATPLTVDVLTNLVAMRTGGSPAYALTHVDLSSNCLQGTAPADVAQITVGASALFRAFNMSGNSGIDGTKPLCGNPSSRPADCDGSFNNKFACADDYFVDFGGQVTSATGAITSDTPEKATLLFTNSLRKDETITVKGLVFTSGATGTTVAQLAAAFSNIKKDQVIADINTQNGLSAAAQGTFTAQGLAADYTTGPVIGGNTVVATSNVNGDVTDLSTVISGGPAGAGAIPAVVTITQGKERITETASVTFKDLGVGQYVDVDGLRLTAIANMAATEVATAFGAVAIKPNQAFASVKKGQFSGKLAGYASTTPVNGAVVTFTASSALKDVTDLPVTSGSVSKGTAVAGSAGATESSIATFKALGNDVVLELGGLTYKASASGATADKVAAAYQNLGVGTTATEANTLNGLTNPAAAGSGYFTTGTLTNWATSSANAGTTVTFTHKDQGTVQTALAVTSAAVPASDPTFSGRVTGAVGATESQVVTFTAVVKGTSLTIAGLTYSVPATATLDSTTTQTAQAWSHLQAGMDAQAANVANNLRFTAAGQPNAGGTFTAGILTGWSTGDLVATDAVTFTADAGGVDVASNLAPTSSAVASVPTVEIKNGAPTVTETAVFKFNDVLPTGGIVTIAGLTFTASAATPPIQLATALADKYPTAVTCAASSAFGTCGGALTAWQSGKVNGDTVTFTYWSNPAPAPTVAGATGPVTDITYTGTNYAPVVATVSQGAKASAESASLAFAAGGIQGGQSVTIAGLTYMPTAAAAGADLAAAFANLNAGATTGPSASKGTYTGTLNNYKTGANTGATLVATSTLLGNLVDLAPTSTSSKVTSVTPAAGAPGATGQQGTAAVIEEYVAKFTGTLAAGQGFTLAGLVLTNAASGVTMTKEQVAAAFANLKPTTTANLANPFTATWSGGPLAQYCTGPVNAADTSVTFTACVDNENVDDLATDNTAQTIIAASNNPFVGATNNPVSNPALTPTPKQGGTGSTETAAVKFNAMVAGEVLTLAGLTYTAKTGGSAAVDVAKAFQSLGYGTTADTANTLNTAANSPTTGVFSGGPLTGWSTGAVATDTVTFKSTTINTDVTNLVQTTGSVNLITTVAGAANTAAGSTPETSAVTFQALTATQVAAAGGLSFTSIGNTAAIDVAAAFANLPSGSATGKGASNGVYTGVLSGWTSGPANGAVVTFTATASGRNTADTATLVTPTVVSGTSPTLPTVTKTGSANGAVALQERSTVIFDTPANIGAGNTVTVAGLAFKVGTTPGATTAVQFAKAWANIADGTTAATLNARTVTGVTFSDTAQGKFVEGTALTGWNSGDTSTATVTFTYTGAAPGTNVADLVPYGTGLGATVAAPTITQGTDGSYPYALVCGGNNYYVNYYMYEACVLNQIRKALDAGVGTPVAQNNTALLTWMGDRACPSKNAVPWTGVSCDTNDRVTGINLSGQKITGTMPLDFFFLANLKTLDLSNNRIGGTFPTGTYQKWANARGEAVTTTISPIPTALETFNIANNRISGGLDATAGTALVSSIRKNVDLSNNCLRGPLPISLTGVAAGATLNLNGNRGKTGTTEEILCQAATPASVLAVCNNRFTNELACSDYAGSLACDGVTYDNYQAFEACILKRIGTALGANLAALGWTGTAVCPPAATPWTGITCDSQLTDAPGVRDRVVKIDLSGRGLTGSLPFDIYYLSALQELNLANNVIKGTLPTQSVVVNGATVTAFPFPTTIRRVFLQNNALTGTLNAALPAFLELGKFANGTLQITDFNINNNCFSGPLASTFDAFIPRVTRVSFNGNQGLCTGVTTASTLAVCDSSSVNAGVCAGTNNPGTNTTLPPFSVLVQARFAVNPSIFNDAALLEALRCDTADNKFKLPCAWVQIVAGYIYETTIGAIISRALGNTRKATTQELQSVIQFRIFADNAAAATAAINNFINNPTAGRFPAVAGSIAQGEVVLPPTAPVAPRVPAVPTLPTAPAAPVAPFTPAKDGDDDGWKIGVGVGVGVGGFLLCVIIICIVVFCLKKKAAPLPQEIDYNKVAVVQQGVPGAYPVYAQGAYPVYPQGAYAVSAPPPTPAYTYAVAA